MLKKNQWDFLWNDKGDHHKYHLIGWKAVCKLVKEGLSIWSIKKGQPAMLRKWLWRLRMMELVAEININPEAPCWLW